MFESFNVPGLYIINRSAAVSVPGGVDFLAVTTFTLQRERERERERERFSSSSICPSSLKRCSVTPSGLEDQCLCVCKCLCVCVCVYVCVCVLPSWQIRSHSLLAHVFCFLHSNTVRSRGIPSSAGHLRYRVITAWRLPGDLEPRG